VNKHPEQEVQNETPLAERIARCAHALWEAEGCPEGADVRHWLQAEAEVLGEMNPAPSGESPEPL
jgi:hypothetical protein